MRMKVHKHVPPLQQQNHSSASFSALRRHASSSGRIRRAAFILVVLIALVSSILVVEVFLFDPNGKESPEVSSTKGPREKKGEALNKDEAPQHHYPEKSSASSSAAAVLATGAYENALVVVHCDDASELAFNFRAFPTVAVFSNCLRPRHGVNSNRTILILDTSPPMTVLSDYDSATGFVSRSVDAAGSLRRKHLIFLSNAINTFHQAFPAGLDNLLGQFQTLVVKNSMKKGADEDDVAGVAVTGRVVDGDRIIMDGIGLVETSSSGAHGVTMSLVNSGRPAQQQQQPPVADVAEAMGTGGLQLQPHALVSIVECRTIAQRLAHRPTAATNVALRKEPLACQSALLMIFLASLRVQTSAASGLFELRQRSVVPQVLLPVVEWIGSDFFGEAPASKNPSGSMIISDGAKLRGLVLQELADASSQVLQRRRLSDVVLHWDPYCGCTGINIEAINFIVPLEEVMRVRAVASSDCWCKGFCSSDVAALRRAQQPKLLDSLKTIWVSHKPVDAFPSFPYSGAIDFGPRPNFVVGRTMIETDRISSSWVGRLNMPGAVDELWVPSRFLVDAFYKSGVRRSLPIYVVPEAIDVHVYNANRFSKSQRTTNRIALLKEAQIDVEAGGGSSSNFIFLSNFKWEPRKGWDVLLRAYFSTFSRRDAVVLLIKTYLYLDPAPRDVNRLKERVRRFAQANGFATESLPKIGFLMSESDAQDMPAMYNAVDCFVLPTRGEGWGLPLQEAMTMGLPTIGTNWGGNTDFMNETNSFLVDVDGMLTEHELQAGIGRQLPFTQLHERETVDKGRAASGPAMFAEPSAKHLGMLMKFVVAHKDGEAAERAARGAALMRERYSREAVRDVVLDRLTAIRARL